MREGKIIITLEQFRPKMIKDRINDFNIIVLYSQSEDHLFSLNFIKNKSNGMNDYKMFEDVLNMIINETNTLYNCKVSCDICDGESNYDYDNNISWQNQEQVVRMIDNKISKEFVIYSFDDDLYGNGSNTNFKDLFDQLIPYLKDMYNLNLEFKEMID